jgi:hypothetical protein
MKLFRSPATVFKFNAVFALLKVGEIAGADPLDTWTLSGPLPQIGLSAIAYAQQEFVAVGWPGVILTSADGVNWVQRQTSIQDATNSALHGVAYGNGQFVAVGETARVGGGIVLGVTGTIVTSADGVSWVQRQCGTPTPLKAIAYGNGQFIAVNDSDTTLLTSVDGMNWGQRRLPIQTGIAAGLYGIGYGNGRFVAVGRVEEYTMTKGDVLSSPIILTSADGVNWPLQVLRAQPYTGLNAVTYGNGQFVAVGAGYTPDLIEASSAVILTSTDGTNWVQQKCAARTGLNAVVHAAGQFVAAGSRGILTSHDGVTWVQRESTTDNGFSGIAYGNSHFVAVGGYPTILESGSIITLAITPNASTGLLSLSLEGPTGVDYTVQTSTDLISWQTRTNITGVQPSTVMFDVLPSAADHLFYRAYSQ